MKSSIIETEFAKGQRVTVGDMKTVCYFVEAFNTLSFRPPRATVRYGSETGAEIECYLSELVAVPNSLNDLPTIIKEPGEYVTRSGCRVTIHEIKPTLNTPTDNGRTEFRAKGTIYVPDRKAAKRGKVRFVRVYNAWHVSGRNLPIHESSTDIVGLWSGPLNVEVADE